MKNAHFLMFSYTIRVRVCVCGLFDFALICSVSSYEIGKMTINSIIHTSTSLCAFFCVKLHDFNETSYVADAVTTTQKKERNNYL